MSDVKEFDFVVIGGGSGGYAAARTAVDNGLSGVSQRDEIYLKLRWAF